MFHWGQRIAFLIFAQSIRFQPQTIPAWLYASTSILQPQMWLALRTGERWLMLTVDAVEILMSCHFSKFLKGIFAIFKNMPGFLEWNPLISKGVFFWNMYYLEYQKKLIFKYGEPAYTENSWFLCWMPWVYVELVFHGVELWASSLTSLIVPSLTCKMDVKPHALLVCGSPRTLASAVEQVCGWWRPLFLLSLCCDVTFRPVQALFPPTRSKSR